MISIVKAVPEDFGLIAEIGKTSFTESHGHSASPEEISKYINEKYVNNAVKAELINTENIYHIIYYNNQPAGYSKINFNEPHSNINEKNITKLDRLYLLKEFYDLKLGHELFKFNIELSKQNHQKGMWLFVWKENFRAVYFYKKEGFRIIGSYDFKLSETHSNPNHQMLIVY
ncbi:MAG TPA: GNAT family N-acetyltransferase [Ignavibacteria bacterium]|nr:GNAT family N-acetyltransferase [Ignavibacteria bacterium]